MVRNAILALGLVGCGAPRDVPVGPGPVPPPILPPDATPPPPTDVVDRGTFLIRIGGQDKRDDFEIKKTAEGFLLTSRDPDVENGSAGELVVDAQFRPLHGTIRVVTSYESRIYKLGGSPLTIESTDDQGGDAQKVVATGPIDIYLNG